MRTAFISLPAFLIIACVLSAKPESSPPSGEEQRAGDIQFDPQKYYSEFYAAVVEAMVSKAFEGDPAFDEIRRAEVIAYVYETKSKQAFADEFQKVYERLLESVRQSGHFKGKEVERAIDGADNVGMPIAIMMSSACIEVYRRKVLHPDFTAPYFANTTDSEQASLIAWIQRRASEEEAAAQDFGGFEREANDEIYIFRSPQVTWNVLTGRSGYLVIRKDKLVHHIVTTMN